MQSFDAATLANDYQAGTITPADVVEEALARIARRGADGVWIALAPRDRLLDDARALAQRRAAGERLPLYGLPFAVKDNIDVAGLPTTAACPAFAYRPEAHASVVARLIAAGALVVGKTNLDQFATGLVGVRSPYGVARNPFDDRFIVGGSSSGSAVAVAVGEVSFALGTDTAGSGRVPAAFNNIVGLKPSRGLFSTAGVVPACRSLDCVSVFALTVEDAVAVADVACGLDLGDPGSRPDADGFRFQPTPRPPHFRFGVPAGPALSFLGDGRTAELYERAVIHLQAMGGERVDIDFAPFREAGSLLYEGAFVAERLEAAGRTLAENPEALVGPVRTILEGATRFDARAAFEAQHRLAGLRRRAGALLRQVDFLFVPTTPTIYAIDEVAGVALAAQRAARHLRELRQPARSGGDGGSPRVPDGRPARRRDADRAVGPGRVAGDVRLGAAPEDVSDDGRDRRAVARRRRHRRRRRRATSASRSRWSARICPASRSITSSSSSARVSFARPAPRPATGCMRCRARPRPSPA